MTLPKRASIAFHRLIGKSPFPKDFHVVEISQWVPESQSEKEKKKSLQMLKKKQFACGLTSVYGVPL